MSLSLIIFTAARAADVDVIGDEVIAKEGLGDTWMAGSREVKEGYYLIIALGEHHLRPGHLSISPLAVA